MTLRVILAACRMQLAESRRQPAHLLILVTNPLFAAMFLSVTTNANSPRGVTSAVFAPALISLWVLSLDVGGSMITKERWQRTLDQLIVTPTRLGTVIFGRILAVVLLAVLVFVEAYLVARLAFDVDVRIPHAGILLVGLLATLLAMVGTATALAGLFVLSRKTYLYQNAMTYPFYLLGGVLVPVALLPIWVQPVSRLFFLSWSSDLIRASLRPAPVPHWWLSMLAIAGLGVAALLGGIVLIERIVDRVRTTGSVIRS